MARSPQSTTPECQDRTLDRKRYARIIDFSYDISIENMLSHRADRELAISFCALCLLLVTFFLILEYIRLSGWSSWVFLLLYFLGIAIINLRHAATGYVFFVSSKIYSALNYCRVPYPDLERNKLLRIVEAIALSVVTVGTSAVPLYVIYQIVLYWFTLPPPWAYNLFL